MVISMSFLFILCNYILPPFLALIGCFFGVLIGGAILLRYLNNSRGGIKNAQKKR